MRLKLAPYLALLLLVCAVAFSPAQAQNPDSMMPEQSTAKANQILDQLINAMGGPSYTEVKESECFGRRAQFGHNGDLTGYIDFKAYWHYPDKYRIDYAKKGNIIDLYNGDEGWTLDRGGVSEEPATSVSDFQESVKRNFDNLLRFRRKEPGMNIRYGGSDIVDLRQIDWVEMEDADGRVFRLAVEKSSHLPSRLIVSTVDEATRERHDEITLFSNIHAQDGVQTPLQVSRQRDGRRILQAFYDSCRYNSKLPADLFTKAALEKRATEVGVKKDKKKQEEQRPSEAVQ